MYYQTDRVLKLTIGLLLFALTSCSWGEPIFISRTITIDEAIAKGFLIYLPSPQWAQAANADPAPVITFEERDDCSSLRMQFYCKESERNYLVAVWVSNGCAFSTLPPPIERVYLEWGGQDVEAQVLALASPETDTVVSISEPTKHGWSQYVVFYDGTLTTTLEFLDAMERVSQD